MKIITIQKTENGRYVANVNGHKNNQAFAHSEVDALKFLVEQIEAIDDKFIQHPPCK